MAFHIIKNLTSSLALLSFVSAVYLGASEDVINAPTCEFTEWALDANCRNLDLDSIPSAYQTAISMDLRNNQLDILEAGDFTGFSDLRYLDLEFNIISDITNGAFVGCNSLLYIYLQFNSLQSIVEGAFEGAVSLERLFLNQNSISQLHHDAFRGLGALTGLYIGHNEISQFPPGLFRHTSSLKYLHIGDNRLTNLSSQIFADLSDLSYLNIMNNNLKSIEIGTFDPLKNLEELDLSGNLLISINDFPTLPKLKILDLYDNQIQKVGSLSETVNGLDELYLGQNNLSCTCSMNAIREWIQHHKFDEGVDASKVDLTCPSPPHLEGKVLSSILWEELCPASTSTKSAATTRHEELHSSFQSSTPRMSATSGRQSEDKPHDPLSTSNPTLDPNLHKPMIPHQTLMPRTSAATGRHNEDESHDAIYTSNPRNSVASGQNNDDQDLYVPKEKYLFLGLDDAIVYVLVAGVTVSVIVLSMCVIIRCLVWRTEKYHQQIQAATMKRQQKKHVTAHRISFPRDEYEDPYSYIPSQPPPYDARFELHEGFSNDDNVIPGSRNAYPHHIGNLESSESRLFRFRPLPPSSPIPTQAGEQLYRHPSHKHTRDGYQAVTVPEGYNGNLDVMYPEAPVIPRYDYKDLGIEADQCQNPHDSPLETPQNSPQQIKHEYFTQFWRIPTQGQQV